jgi:capsule polysaccharide export protein KpsE/RkpR
MNTNSPSAEQATKHDSTRAMNGSSTAELHTSEASGEHSMLHDALRLLALVVRHSRFILIVTAIAAVVSAAASFLFLKNEYAASVNALPPRRAGSVLDNLTGNISSTLKDFGLTKLTGGKSDGYTQLVILQSRRMQDTLIQLYNLAKLYDIKDTNLIDLRKELAEHLAIGQEDEGNYMITVWHENPTIAAEMANKIVEIGNFFASEVYQAEARVAMRLLEQRYRQEDSNWAAARDSLAKFSRRYKLYSPLDQAKGAAAALAELRVKRYEQELKLQLAETAYGAQDPAVQAQRKLLQELAGQQQRAESQPGLAGEFSIAGVGSDVAIEYARLYTDLEFYTRLRAVLLPMVEQSRQDISRTMPALYVLDPAIPPNKKDRPKRSLIIAGTTLGALILAVLYVILRDRFLTLRARYKAIIQEG